ncbi:uncharacterized protein BO80DRAFT_425681 [Aspergillus ibericus CBS 121593]|uniref:Uncharacterized protein n=1 Tax=Aspergillus ibericus CBS 121593 TaxID=1448316 RepID=A0A395GY75_9EURO|nr:hypothetical protein BO80DRAFT_425681 [Aspergillus ibericus CBS 121593]RAL00517.1 hypothetical protein BO80DRAFT_425681 [Aspergillus ibericus CBS 121593]
MHLASGGEQQQQHHHHHHQEIRVASTAAGGQKEAIEVETWDRARFFTAHAAAED